MSEINGLCQYTFKDIAEQHCQPYSCNAKARKAMKPHSKAKNAYSCVSSISCVDAFGTNKCINGVITSIPIMVRVDEKSVDSFIAV